MGETIKTLSVKQKREINDIVNNLYEDLKNRLNFIEVSKEINPDFGMKMFTEAIYLDADFTYNDRNYKIIFVKKTFKDENIIIETTLISENNSTTLNDEIYTIKTALKEVQTSYFKGVYWQKDTQNERNCSELYEKVHILENRFREIIVQFMVNKYGFAWTKNQISEELNEKIKGYSRWYRDNYTIFKNVKTELFNLQVNDLITLLKKAYDKKTISDSELVKFITTDNTDPNDIIQKISEYKACLVQLNVWDKYFEPLLGDQFNELWSTFNSMRNMVAHNKPICLDLYYDTNQTINDIHQIFDSVVEKFNETFKSTEDIEIDELFLELNEEYSNEMDYARFEEAGIEATPTEQEVLDQITESEQIQSIIEGSKEYISVYTGILEEILDFINDDLEQNLDFSNHTQTRQQLVDISNIVKVDLKKAPNNFLQELSQAVTDEDFEDIWSDIKSEIEDYCNDMTNKISSSKVEEEFYLEAPLVEINTSTSLVKIVSQGFISPERGSSNNLVMFLVDNGVEKEEGCITKDYGDYFIDEHGGALASQGDELVVSLDALIGTYNNTLQDDLDLVGEIRDNFFDLV